MISRSGHRWRLATAWTTVVALLFHVAILLTPNLTHADGLGNNVILCSSFGQSSVALADLDGDHVPDRVPEKGSAPDGSFFCPICASAQLLGAALPAVGAILPQRAVAANVSRPIQSDAIAVAVLIAGSGPRAPPSIV
jgi:hypothetical protein